MPAARGIVALAALAFAACAGTPRRVDFAPVPPGEVASLRSVHDGRGGNPLCQGCHLRGEPAPALLRGDPVALCTGCHRQSHAGNHPVGVPVRGPSGGLPLWKGTITCVSCHDPHAIRVGKGFHGDPGETCLKCHQKHGKA